MDEIDLKQMEQILLKRKCELTQNLENLKESAKPVDLNSPHGRLSRQDALQHQQISLNGKKKVELELRQLEQALERIKDESYGYCLRCEAPILKKRLLAKPESPFCTDCSAA